MLRASSHNPKEPTRSKQLDQQLTAEQIQAVRRMAVRRLDDAMLWACNTAVLPVIGYRRRKPFIRLYVETAQRDVERAYAAGYHQEDPCHA
jgi:hypothetical protein